MTAIAPAISSHRKYRLPCFEIPPEPLLAAGRMLPGHEPNPGRQATSGRERLPITDFGDQCGGDDRTHARDVLEPSALFARSMPTMDLLLDDPDLRRDIRVLAGKRFKAQSRRNWNAIVPRISKNPRGRTTADGHAVGRKSNGASRVHFLVTRSDNSERYTKASTAVLPDSRRTITARAKPGRAFSRSAGLAPLSTFPTQLPPRRKTSRSTRAPADDRCNKFELVFRMVQAQWYRAGRARSA
jgi:hypothetical protein